MCIANWISYAYIQIHSFPDSFSIYVIVEYWVEFSILYSVFPGGLVSKQSASNAGDVDSIPELGISSGEGNGNPHQYSCLENWSLLLSILYIVVCVCVCVCLCVLSRFRCVWLFVTLWIVAHWAPLSMGFSRQESWNGLPCLPPGELPDPGIEPTSLMSPALAGEFFTKSTTWEGV